MICELCDKHQKVANRRSHSNIKTKRVQKANVQSVNCVVGGSKRRVAVCTACIRSGFVQKAHQAPRHSQTA